MKKTIFFLVTILTAIVGFSQMDQSKMKSEKTSASKSIKYTCPMHAEVISNKPGKCPKCGMNLIEKKAEVKKVYTCPMHADVVSDKAGKCPKCGMNLVEKKLNK